MVDKRINMEDTAIVDLYWARNEMAITVTKDKYGKYCFRVALNVLYSDDDSEECVNDTYLAAWNSMPENRPGQLGAYLAAITRNLALDRYRKNHAERRGGGNVPLVLDELIEIAGNDSTEEQIEHKYLVAAINAFLGTLPAQNRNIFVLRYFYMDSIETISDKLCVSESKVKTSLCRMRNKLREYLEKEGISV